MYNEVLKPEGVWQFRLLSVQEFKQEASMKLLCCAPHADHMGFWMRSASTLADSKFQLLAEHAPALVFDAFWHF